MTRKLKIQFYRDKKHEWRWRIKSSARILADSGEGYKRLASAISGFNRVSAFTVEGTARSVSLPFSTDARDAMVEVIR